MAYKFKDMEKIVGIFIVVALLAFLSLIILIMRGKDFFVKKNTYYTYYNSGEGITKGMPVNYNGMKIGQVNDMNLNPDNRIYIKFYVLTEYADRVKLDSVFDFVPGLLGGGKITITRGTVNGPPLPNGAYINSADSELGKKLLKLQPATVGEGLAGIVNNVNEITRQLKSSEGALAKLQLLLTSVNDTTKNVKNITGSVDKDQINTIVLNLRLTTDNLVEITKNLKHNRLIGGSPEKNDKNSLPATK